MSLSASPHHISVLALCPKPHIVTQMGSFIGAFKVFSCVIPGCSTLLAKCDDTVACCESKETIQWTDDLGASFYKAQAALSTAHTTMLPIPSDQLWIITVRSLHKPRIGATLYVTCNDKTHPIIKCTSVQDILSGNEHLYTAWLATWSECPNLRCSWASTTGNASFVKVHEHEGRQQLKHHRISIDLRYAKNHNRNPVAQRAVEEFENELL